MCLLPCVKVQASGSLLLEMKVAPTCSGSSHPSPPAHSMAWGDACFGAPAKENIFVPLAISKPQ